MLESVDVKALSDFCKSEKCHKILFPLKKKMILFPCPSPPLVILLKTGFGASHRYDPSHFLKSSEVQEALLVVIKKEKTKQHNGPVEGRRGNWHWPHS